VVGHIECVWQRGKEAIDALREALGPDLQDVLCPLRNGGVSLHKLYGVMHDICNCANKIGKRDATIYTFTKLYFTLTTSTFVYRLRNSC
jgi:hypothetical protein